MAAQAMEELLASAQHPVIDRSRPPWITVELDCPATAVRLARLLQERSGIPLALGVHTEASDGVHPIPKGRVGRRAAQLAAAASPPQLLLSDLTAAMISSLVALPIALVGLGAHRVHTLEHSDPVHQLVDPDQPDGNVVLRSLRDRPGNLPVAAGSFVGRSAELEQLVAELDAARCVSLLGIGGVGKTRLAMRVGGELLPFHPDGVWMVDLASIVDPALVVTAVARVVGARIDRVDDATAALVAHLVSRRALLVVDNCEGVADALGALLTGILEGCPDVAVLATSREPLPVSGGRSVVLRPLPTTAPPGMQPDAVSLFLERAPRTEHWSPDRSQRSAIANICDQLDGLPLAVELVAAETLSTAPTVLLTRLRGHTLDFGDSSRGSSRHRTLRDALDWSHQLLDEEEAVALRRLAVCHGFDLDMAQAVMATDSGANAAVAVARLVQRSLVVPSPSEPTARYRMLHVVREHALERLAASGEEDGARDAHARFVVERAMTLHDDVRRAGSTVALDRLDADLANIRTALEHLCARERYTEAMELVLGIQLFWNSRHPTEALIWFRRLLDHAECLVEDRAATLLAEAGRIALHAGEVELAETLCWRSHGLARHHGRCPPGAAYSALTQLLLYDNDASGALSLCEEAMTELSAAGDHIGLLSARSTLSGAAHALGQTRRAIEVAAQNRAVAERSGNRTLEAGALLTFATAHRRLDVRDARRLLGEALVLARVSGPTVTKWALIECGQVDLDLGQLEAAHMEFREAVALAHDAGDPTALAAALEGCAAVALETSEYLVAARLIATSGLIRGRPRHAGRPDDVALRQRVLTGLARATDGSWAAAAGSMGPDAITEAIALCGAWLPGTDPSPSGAPRPDAVSSSDGRREVTADEEATLAELIERHLPSRDVIRRRYATGASIFRVGDPCRHTYVVSSGAVKLSLASVDGREVVWSIAGPGDLLGDVAALTRSRRWCTATAINDAVVAEIPAATLVDAARRRPDLARAWLVALATRLKEAAERQLQFGSLDAQARVCLCLLGLADRFGSSSPGAPGATQNGKISFTLPFAQQDLAAWAGISREALVRALRSLRSTGAVESNGRRFVISPDLLRSRAS
jgi:predicted ATPase/CRP-like cAMP-binding protein